LRKRSAHPQKEAQTRIFIRFFSICEFAKKRFSGYNISYFKPVLRKRESPSTLNLERADNFRKAGRHSSLSAEERAGDLRGQVCPELLMNKAMPRAARIVPERSVEWKPLQREIT
jgi:hypothetical protein